MSLFNALEIGKRSLLAHQTAMDVTGHNIANANTEGYSRQLAILGTTAPTVVPVGNSQQPLLPLGTGSCVDTIERIKDEYITARLRKAESTFGQYNMITSELDSLEVVFNEPSDNGLSAQFNAFWDSWQNLYSPDPANSGARAEVRASGSVLADSIRRMYQDLLTAQEQINQKIVDRVAIVNDTAASLANLNQQIGGQNLLGAPNDLMDERDRLLKKLAQYVNIEANISADNTANVSIGGTLIVAGINTFALATRSGTDGTDVYWEASQANANISSGEIKGLMQIRDENINQYVDQLNELAVRLSARVNAVHRQGYDQNGVAGENFFTGSNAQDIEVNPEIIDNIGKIAASSNATGAVGNGANALSLSQVRDELLMANNTQTIEGQYIATLTDLGSTAGEAKRLMTNTTLLKNQLTELDTSTSGVSIDEEMTSLMKYESGYQAAAKFISIIDELIKGLVNLL